MRPPAVTRRPGGDPCSLSSLSALAFLIEGEGDGRFAADLSAAGSFGVAIKVGAEVAGSTFSDCWLMAEADAEGLRTCAAIWAGG